MAQDVTEKVKEYAGKITDTVVDGYHKVEEKLKDMTGMGKHDQNKKWWLRNTDIFTRLIIKTELFSRIQTIVLF